MQGPWFIASSRAFLVPRLILSSMFCDKYRFEGTEVIQLHLADSPRTPVEGSSPESLEALVASDFPAFHWDGAPYAARSLESLSGHQLRMILLLAQVAPAFDQYTPSTAIQA